MLFQYTLNPNDGMFTDNVRQHNFYLSKIMAILTLIVSHKLLARLEAAII